MPARKKASFVRILRKQPLPDFMVELDPAMDSLWFCDNRLVMQAGYEGPTRLDYYCRRGSGTKAQSLLSVQGNSFFECLRPNVKVGMDRYAAEEGRLLVAPFGYYRHQVFPDGRFEVRTGIWLADDCVIFSFDLLGKVHHAASAEFTIWPQCFLTAADRTWTPWTGDVKSMTRRSTDAAKTTTFLSVSASGPLVMREYREKIDTHFSGKFRFATPLESGKTAFMVLALGNHKRQTQDKAHRVAHSADSVLLRQFRRYQQVSDRSPRLKSGSAMLDRFARCMPLYQESLKVVDTPGVRRAKTSSYWAWLWDAALPGMVDPYHGDASGAVDMSRFFIKFAHLPGGVPFAFPLDLEALLKSGNPDGNDKFMNVQGLVEIMVHDTAALTGRREIVKEFYPRLRNHFTRMAATVVGETGLLAGITAFPDARHLMDETDDGMSTFNNACWYNACRKMERMALAMGDAETAVTARKIARAIESSFWRTFWNVGEGYLAGSADFQGRHRDVFYNGSTFFDFGYGDELCDGYKRRLTDYQLAHFYSNMGISIFSPRHPRIWDRDGNQFHCSWPVMDSHCLKLATWARSDQALAQFVPWVESLVARHTAPEAIQMRVKKGLPVIYDPGAWQAYTMSSWYRVIVECLMGVTMDSGGVTLAGTASPPMQLHGLHYRGGRLNIRTESSGWEIARLLLDGKPVPGTHKISACSLEGGDHDLRVIRSSAAAKSWRVLIANGSSVEVSHADARSLRFTLIGTGLSRVLLYAPGMRRVTIDRQPTPLRRAEQKDACWIQTVLSHRQSVQVEAH